MINFIVHDDYVFVLMIITLSLIKMLNVDALYLSSQMSIAHYQTLMYEYTLVDLYLFMWRETVDFRVAEWIFCLVHFQHYLAFDRTINHSEVTFCTIKPCTWIRQNMFVSFFFRKMHCFIISTQKVHFFVIKVYSAKACTFVPSPCLYNYDQFDSVCIPSIKMLLFIQQLLCWKYKICIQ